MIFHWLWLFYSAIAYRSPLISCELSNFMLSLSFAFSIIKLAGFSGFAAATNAHTVDAPAGLSGRLIMAKASASK